MTTWEYRVLKVEIGRFTGPKVDISSVEATLDRLGAEGWELVSTLDTTSPRAPATSWCSS